MSERIFMLLVLVMLLFLPGCEIIAGIFKAGFWTAIVLVLLVIGVGIFIFKKASKRGDGSKHS